MVSYLTSAPVNGAAATLARQLMEAGELTVISLDVKYEPRDDTLDTIVWFKYRAEVGIHARATVEALESGSNIPLRSFINLLQLWRDKCELVGLPVLTELLSIDFSEKHGIELKEVLAEAAIIKLWQVLDSEGYPPSVGVFSNATMTLYF